MMNTTTCTQCAQDAVSAEKSAWCRSCEYADASSSGFWSSVVKVHLKANGDQSQCEVKDHTHFWFIVVRDCCCTLGVGFVLACFYFVHRTSVLETYLHGMIRKQKWTDAKTLLDNIPPQQKVRVGCSWIKKSAAQLVNRRGMDGRTPLQLALEWGEKNGVSMKRELQMPMDADVGGTGDVSPHRETPQSYGSAHIGNLQVRIQQEADSNLDIPLLSGQFPIGETPSADVKHESDIERWRALVNSMLELQHYQHFRTERSSQRVCTRKLQMLLFKFNLFFWISIGTIWTSLMSLTELGATLDQGSFAGVSNVPPTSLQECGRWCTAGAIVSILISLVVMIPEFFLVSCFTSWVFTLFDAAKRTSDDVSVVALLGIVNTFVLTVIFGVIDGAFLEYGGMVGGGLGLFTGIVTVLIYGLVVTELFLLTETDPFATSLKRMLHQNQHSVEGIWPLVQKCIVSTGPVIWQLILVRKLGSRWPHKRAVDIAAALAKNARTIEDSARVLNTLLEAHIAGIVDTKICAACIAQVTSIDPSARLYRGTEKSSPAEIALLSAKATEIKREALIVLFDRFAVVSLEERVYESATCRVYRAEDLQPGSKTFGNIVAIKLFADRVHYAKEVAMRELLDFDSSEGIAGSSVVADYQRYDHNDAAIDCARPRAEWKQAIITKLYGKFGSDGLGEMEGFGSGAIVMPLAEYDLNIRLSLTRIAGIDTKECISIIRPIASALASLHHLGIVHGDVKPRNVVYVDGTWKLIDLDAAHAIDNIIDASAPDFKWTSGFASPELARCRTFEDTREQSEDGSVRTIPADPKMDVFSLGILIFELLTGQSLFRQDTCNNSMVDR